MTTLVVFAVALAIGGFLAFRPLLGTARPWPSDPADQRDDIERAVSSLRDLEFARAAGTIDPRDAVRLRAILERGAFATRPTPAAGGAPVRTLIVGALLAAIAAVLVAAYLPRAAGDRAPGTTITGTLPRGAPTTAELEARAAASPNDVPTLLALADAYRDDQRASDAASVYRRVLAIDRDNVPALYGVALILFRSGEPEGARLANDRVLALRPRDTDALFLGGLIRYQKADYNGAVELWNIYLDVGEFHPAFPMVKQLYDDAKRKGS
ncbi:MAG: tetratricopeptide repeat protein [Chloroflexi bacterium]|nr:tetratricopeptide repeat protein [Chloroflexota bacterium]